MKTSTAKIRKDDNGQQTKNWRAEDQPSYPALALALQALEDIEATGIAEIGADINDAKENALSIVWANYPYFTRGNADMDFWGWLAVDLKTEEYFGISPEGDEWRIPLADPEAARKAATLLTTEE